MDLANKNICFVSAYSAPYGGNFIKMLSALAHQLKTQYKCQVNFIFPKQSEKDWLTELSDKFEVGFVICENLSEQISGYFIKWNTDLVHTHFEAYDVAVSKAIKRSPRRIWQVWHIHDYMTLDKTGLSFPAVRKFFTNQRLWRQYGKWGRDAYFIAVSDEMARFVNHYRRHRFKYPNISSCENFVRTTAVLNGIDLSRLAIPADSKKTDRFTFLTFGGESISKGIPTILCACEMLSLKGIDFRLLLTEGYTTANLLNDRYGDAIPDWLNIIKQTNCISSVFAKADCYISASRKETMSMAIAEASLFGLPVIQSDIPGTMWNASSPSAFLFPVDNAHKLLQSMKVVMDMSTGCIQQLVKEGITLNKHKLSMERWVEKMIEIYNSL